MIVKEKIEKSFGIISEILLKRFELFVLLKISDRLESQSFRLVLNRRAALPNILKNKLEQEINV
jgi:hypothetical protein